MRAKRYSLVSWLLMVILVALESKETSRAATMRTPFSWAATAAVWEALNSSALSKVCLRSCAPARAEASRARCRWLASATCIP